MISNTIKKAILCFGSLVFVGFFVIKSSSAEEPTPKSQADIEAIVRNYLLANPEILNEMATKLERRAKDAQNRQAQEAIRSNQTLLNSDKASMSTVLGNPNGDVTLVEFSDYNCGFCKRFHPNLTALISEDQGVRIVVKEFPILSKSSLDAARAALAAGMQGKYKDFHDSLMTSRQKITKTLLEGIAKKLELDMKRWHKDQSSPEVQAEIAQNTKLARDIGITGTPSFIIGSEFVRGLVSLETLQNLVTAARKQ